MCRQVNRFITGMTILLGLLPACGPIATSQVVTAEAPLIEDSIPPPEITVVTEEWPPYNYAEKGRVVGISTEIVRATLAKANLPAEIKIYPWARAYKMAQEQKGVLIYSIVRNEERENLFKWIGPIVPPSRFFLHKLKDRTDIIINSLEDAKKYRIGVITDSSEHLFLRAQGFKEDEQLYPVAYGEQNAEKIFLGRIDLIAENEWTLPMRLKKMRLPLNRVEKVILLYEGGEGYYMAFSPQTPDELVERVRIAFGQVKAEGLPEVIMKKYLK